MSLYKNKYRIESVRLKGFDYSQAADYYVTICVKGKKRHLGSVENGGMKLSKKGNLVFEEWEKLETDFKGIKLKGFTIMPEHMHGIIRIGRKTDAALSGIVQSFKSKSTILINKKFPQDEPFRWQKNYFDRIIRGEKEFYFVSEYIKNNPLKTDPDNYYKEWWELQQIRKDNGENI
jgi:REP element-mobilizing transposase RayT